MTGCAIPFPPSPFARVRGFGAPRYHPRGQADAPALSALAGGRVYIGSRATRAILPMIGD